jgi:hypothetical protein
MKSLFACLILAAVLTSGGGAKADFETGNELFKVCGSSNPFESGACTGYVTAIADVMLHETVWSWRMCGRTAYRCREAAAARASGAAAFGRLFARLPGPGGGVSVQAVRPPDLT